MLHISRMKSLITPSTFSFTHALSKPTPFAPLLSSVVLPSKSTSFSANPATPRIPFPLPLKPLNLSPKSSFIRCLQSQAPAPSHYPPSTPPGQIHVIVGPMFAGKTTTLLNRIQAETDSGRNVAIIKSNKDTRYGVDSIVTHDGVKLPCWALPNLSSFRQSFGPEAYEKLDVIGIDEAQFFEDLYDFCCEAADHDGKTVIVAGLDGDYLRRSFGSVLDIIPLADSVTKLTARCEICGKRAYFTLRKTGETQTEVIGGADVYMPVCRQHYVSGQVVVKATKVILESKKVKFGFV